MNNNDNLYQFMTCDYYATGEGRTICLLITRAYPRSDDYEDRMNEKLKYSAEEIAKREFSEKFGSWLVRGAEHLSREDFLKKYSHYLPSFVEKSLTDKDQLVNFNFAQSLHVNFS